MSFDRYLTELLDRIGRAGISVEIAPSGGLLARSNGCRVRLFVELAGELYAAHRTNPIRVTEVVSQQAPGASP